MVTRLKSVLQTLKNQLPLLCKAAVFGFLLSLAVQSNFSFGATLVFLLVSFLLYSIPLLQTVRYFWLFCLLLLVSFLAVTAAPASGLRQPVIISLAALFYIFLGIKNIAFAHRVGWYRIFHIALFYLGALLFYLGDKSQPPVLLALAWFGFSLFQIRDFFINSGFTRDARLRLIGWVTSFFSLESAWAFGLLPLPFVSAATALTIFIFMLEEALLHYLKHTLRARLIQVYLMAFLVLELIIFSLARWSL